MAYIIFNKGEQSLINTWLVGAASTNASGATFGIGMGAMTGGVGTDKTKGNGTNVSTTTAEIGQTTANGYARQVVNRNNAGAGGWPASTLSTGSYQTVAPQVTFTFSGAPNLNGATMWFCALSTTIATDDILFGADLAATRTFANGDTEKITVTYRTT
jgi:hypothetical protein